MPFFILKADKALTFFTFVSATSTLLYVIGVYFNFEHLFTIWALLWSHFTMVFMITEGTL